MVRCVSRGEEGSSAESALPFLLNGSFCPSSLAMICFHLRKEKGAAQHIDVRLNQFNFLRRGQKCHFPSLYIKRNQIPVSLLTITVHLTVNNSSSVTCGDTFSHRRRLMGLMIVSFAFLPPEKPPFFALYKAKPNPRQFTDDQSSPDGEQLLISPRCDRITLQ